MFKVVANPTFTHEVRVQVPVDGGYEQQSFRATFRVIATDEVDKFDMTTAAGASDFLRRIVVGFDDLADENKQPIAYSDAVRDAVISLPYARNALAETYFAAISKARKGN